LPSPLVGAGKRAGIGAENTFNLDHKMVSFAGPEAAIDLSSAFKLLSPVERAASGPVFFDPDQSNQEVLK
jgi:hypothetical protein